MKTKASILTKRSPSFLSRGDYLSLIPPSPFHSALSVATREKSSSLFDCRGTERKRQACLLGRSVRRKARLLSPVTFAGKEETSQSSIDDWSRFAKTLLLQSQRETSLIALQKELSPSLLTMKGSLAK